MKFYVFTYTASLALLGALYCLAQAFLSASAVSTSNFLFIMTAAVITVGHVGVVFFELSDRWEEDSRDQDNMILQVDEKKQSLREAA